MNECVILFKKLKLDLKEAGIEYYDFEVKVIFEEVLGKNWQIFKKDLSVNEKIKLGNIINKRINDRIPLQYIVGCWEFYGLNFTVGPGVLIPRADTETLVDVSLDFIKSKLSCRVVDLCSGSGCVGISIAKNNPRAEVYLIEKSKKAFIYLKQNVEKYNILNTTAFNKDIFEDFSIDNIELVVANPPYIKTSDIDILQPEVKHEPRAALDGGIDGIEFYRGIIEHWTPKLKPKGAIALEIGLDQANIVGKMLKQKKMQVSVFEDLNKINRVVLGVRWTATHTPQS